MNLNLQVVEKDYQEKAKKATNKAASKAKSRSNAAKGKGPKGPIVKAENFSSLGGGSRKRAAMGRAVSRQDDDGGDVEAESEDFSSGLF